MEEVRAAAAAATGVRWAGDVSSQITIFTVHFRSRRDIRQANLAKFYHFR